MELNVDSILSGRGGVTVGGVPTGAEALLLGELARQSPGRCVVHVARDDARMAATADLVGFFSPDAEVLTFPAWDCMPYDRVGPHRDIVARRIETLGRLLVAPTAAGGRIVVTTVNAAIQRVPSRAFMAQSVLAARVGARLEPDRVVAFLDECGYVRVESVGEAGEFAVRGGILDLFPPGREHPLRLDFFGDELEGIRTFEPLSQRTVGRRDEMLLLPVSELRLDAASIERFREGYRAQFGAVRGDDPLYQAVSAGRHYAGMEHWLPLFHDSLETLLDAAPEVIVTCDHQTDEARAARLDSIADFYAARLDTRRAEEAGGTPYKPLPPEQLYLNDAAWSAMLEGRLRVALTPFAAPGAALDLGGRPGETYAEARQKGQSQVLAEAGEDFDRARADGKAVLVAAYSTGSRDRLARLLRDAGIGELAMAASFAEARRAAPAAAVLVVLGVERGFALDDLVVVSEQDLLGERMVRPVRKRRRAENFLTEASALAAGDIVVHVDHGIGRYDGLEAIEVSGAPHDCLKVLYAEGDRLYVPVENIETLSRYGSEGSEVHLDRLGSAGWQTRKARVRKRLDAIAADLMKVAAVRALQSGAAMDPPEGLYEEFAARFPYAETEDQQRAIDEVLDDLASGRPMDRLVCGDVGFGKTEVALRAAFITALSGRQVAVVVPTTLLCRQHLQTFQERFAGLPVRIGQLSRLVSAADAAKTRKALADGTLDIIIGTHALLGKSIAFRDLGLLIIDEEQHFGVKQKERLKQLRETVHVMTLTATPIPRTLQLALAGVREMSMIATPPVDRLAVRTFVLPFDAVVVREALLREQYRGGQAYYVCPRIEDLPRLFDRLQKLVPEVKIATAHGQMPAQALEKVMTAFYDRQHDVLLSTNIIESGLDIPTVNTIVVHRADMFGLAQLYQLRGRVGRSKVRAYAYLTLPPGKLLTPAAQKRLEVMQTLDTLGAGFTLASYDLDIRGAGNLLGEEQSGQIREVGVELYQHMLEEAIQSARGGGAEAEVRPADWSPQISIGTPVLIPDSYVADLGVRLGLYRRLADLVDEADIESFAAELIDRFGPLPGEVENLLEVMAIKQLSKRAGVAKVDAGPKGAVIAFHNDEFRNPAGLVGFISRQVGSVKLRPDHRMVYRRAWGESRARLAGVRTLLRELADVAREAA